MNELQEKIQKIREELFKKYAHIPKEDQERIWKQVCLNIFRHADEIAENDFESFIKDYGEKVFQMAISETGK